jgi:hypothetical protein
MDTFDTLNTRRYPRTLDEAFPHGRGLRLRADPAREPWREAGRHVALAILIGVCLAGALVQWWSS